MTAMPAATPTAAPAPRRVDVLIIGAGPVGLFAAFQAGVLGLSCEIVEALDAPGGQCTELYPDKPIYDIPALPVCTARELVSRLLEQARPFGAPIHLGQRAQTLAVQKSEGHVADGHDHAREHLASHEQHDGRLLVETDAGLRFDAAAVLLCAGNGAFVPQRISGPAADAATALEDTAIHYAVRDVEAFRGKRVVIAGGGDAALDWALALRDVASALTLVHRRDAFRAADASVIAVREAIAHGAIGFEIGTLDAVHAAQDTVQRRTASEKPPSFSEPLTKAPAEMPAPSSLDSPSTVGALSHVTIKRRDGARDIPADHLLVLYGLVAALGPIGEWGLTIAGGRTSVDPVHYETSLPRVFAAGDIAGYANKQKLILSGFHEAALALRRAYRYARPDQTRTHVHSSYDPRIAEVIERDHGASAGHTAQPASSQM